MKLYSYPRCSTCRKAIAWLTARNLVAETLDITEQPPSIAELEQAMAQMGRQRLFNTSGQSYRALGAASVQAMDDQTALAALATDGKLIKRPFLITDDGRILTGFKEPEWLDLLG
ncbi:MAG: Spx/MgsR family RNA polymerase-binding regulatory protein [Cyanobacteria bacterium]|nr:Spx/MgsR family RNA polymerase-binding regulatory protein [Cyanobacteriota bacterium]MDA1246545.1 Spx/MgsR family RNA polymerase-binding regulatory protein [Cyanobacteriota bacterium]